MGKIMVILFADGEEDVYQRMLQIVNDSKGFEWCSVIQETENVHIGELKIDLSKRSVIVGNKEIILTNRQIERWHLSAK